MERARPTPDSPPITRTRRVAIVIPCRNEEAYIEACLESVLRFEVPADTALEVMVYDGGSTDQTPQIVERFAAAHPEVRLFRNPRRYQAAAVNLAVTASTADFFLWLGAHTQFPRDYVQRCLATADRTGADVVGGFCITQPGGTGYGAQLVQAMTTHKFGVGDSGFRTGAKEGPVDTVAYALFRARVFAQVGLLDERLVRAQDYEFNQRVRRAGLTIWFDPEIRCSYHNQASLGAFYRKQIILEAPYNAYMWWIAPYSFAPRHAITGVFALGVLGGLGLAPLTPWIAWPFAGVMALYALLAIASAVQQAVRYRQPWHLVALPCCFFAFHFLHGLGVLAGLVRLASRTSPVQRAPIFDRTLRREVAVAGR
jgi:glycosyltransferase involved in cell wall biosynthesis